MCLVRSSWQVSSFILKIRPNSKASIASKSHPPVGSRYWKNSRIALLQSNFGKKREKEFRPIEFLVIFFKTWRRLSSEIQTRERLIYRSDLSVTPRTRERLKMSQRKVTRGWEQRWVWGCALTRESDPDKWYCGQLETAASYPLYDNRIRLVPEVGRNL